MHLQQGFSLQDGKYQIIQVLGQGGFGITYLALHTKLNKKLAIKEFFPKELCDRDSTNCLTNGTKSNESLIENLKERFLKEAQNLAKLHHKGIVAINDIFEENNTAYYIMDYIEGESLSSIIKRTGPLSQKKAEKYIVQIACALGEVHKNKMTHFDLKPANIMIRKEDDEPILIDFGLSKQYDQRGNATSSVLQAVSAGYSPIELYNPNSNETFSPQTDIYSLGATLFYLMTGDVPPNASIVMEEGLKIPDNVPVKLQRIINIAMKPIRKDRYSDVKAFLKDINNKTENKITESPQLTDLSRDDRTLLINDDKKGEGRSTGIESEKSLLTKEEFQPLNKDPLRKGKKKKNIYLLVGICISGIILIIGIFFLIIGNSSVNNIKNATYNKINVEDLKNIESYTDDVISDDPSVIIDPSKDVKTQLKEYYDKVTETDGGFYKLQSGNLFGLADSKGKILQKPKFTRITTRNKKGLTKVYDGSKMGYLNLKGVIIVPPVYDMIGEEQEGLIPIEIGGKYGFLDATSLKEVTPCIYDYVYKKKDGLYKVKIGNKIGYLNADGTVKKDPI